MSDKKSVTDEKSVETIETDIVEHRTPIDTPTDEKSGTAIYYETDGTVLSASDVPDGLVIDDDADGTNDTDAETKDGASDSNDDATAEETENEDDGANNGTDNADKDGDGSSDTDDNASEEASDDADTENDDADDAQGCVSSGVTGDDADDTGEGAFNGDVASEAVTDDESADTEATADDDSDDDDDDDDEEEEDDDEDDGNIDCPTGWGPVVTKDERDYVTIKGHSFKPLTLCKVFAALTVAPLAISCGLSFAHMVANFELGFWHYFVTACIYGALLVACLYSIGSFVAANDRYEKALHHCVTYDELSMLIEERGINIVVFGFFAILSIIASIVVGVIMFCIF